MRYGTPLMTDTLKLIGATQPMRSIHNLWKQPLHIQHVLVFHKETFSYSYHLPERASRLIADT
jgi:hypothetical protein